MFRLFYNPLLLLMTNHYVKTFCWVTFLVNLLIHICAFYILCHICLWWLVTFYDLIFLLYGFHLTIMYQYHLLLLLRHCWWWWWWWWWRWWILFVIWLTDERRLALFPAGIIVRDPHHRISPTRHKQGLNLRRTWVQV